MKCGLTPVAEVPERALGAGADAFAGPALSRPDCLGLLASQAVGRVAVADFNAPPLVVPVNYVLDGVDPGRRTGWSVLVQGGAVEVDPDEVRTGPPWPWTPGRKDRWVAIVPETVTGRRIRLCERPGNDRGYL